MAYNKLAIFEKPIFYTHATKNEVISEKLANSKRALFKILKFQKFVREPSGYEVKFCLLTKGIRTSF